MRVFEVEPELLQRLPESAAASARRLVVVEAIHVEVGLVRGGLAATGPSDLGYLVVEGLLVRRDEVAGRVGVELLGAGDLFRPDHESEGSSLPCTSTLQVASPARLAVLDGDFLKTISGWPGVLAELIARVTARAHALSLRLALARLPQLEARLICFFWHLADRWGRVEADGVVVPLRLPHELLADLTCAQRPSVSTALKALSRQGLLDKQGPARWFLHGAPPSAYVGPAADLAFGTVRP